MRRTTTDLSGDATFRALSYAFRVRWDSETVGAYVARSSSGSPCRQRSSLSEPATCPSTCSFPRPPATVSCSTARPSWRVATSAISCSVSRGTSTPPPCGPARILCWCMRGPSSRRQVRASCCRRHRAPGRRVWSPALVRAGWGYLSDEVGAIDPATRQLCPYPKALSIKPGMFERFVDLLDPDQAWPISSREWLIAPETLRPDPVADPTAVGLIVFLEHAPQAAIRLTSLSPARPLQRSWSTSRTRRPGGRGPSRCWQGSSRDARSYSLQTGDRRTLFAPCSSWRPAKR